MIVRKLDEVDELDIEKALGIEGIQTTVRWLIDRNTGGPEYGNKFAMRYFEMQVNGFYPMHKHYYVEGVYLVSGKMAFCSEDKKWVTIEPGDVVYTARWEPHALKNIGDEPAIFICCIDCDEEGEPCEPQARC